MAWLRIFRNKNQVEAKCTNLVEFRGLLRSWSKKAAVQDEGFGLRHSWLLWSPADVQQHLQFSLTQAMTSTKLSNWNFLPIKEFYKMPLFTTHWFMPWEFPERQQWCGAEALGTCFISPHCAILCRTLYLSGSQFHLSCVDFRMWSQQWQEICLHVHFHIPSAKHRAWHLRGAQNICWILNKQIVECIRLGYMISNIPTWSTNLCMSSLENFLYILTCVSL